MSVDLASRELKNPVDIAEYLFTRLHQLGIRSVHGVPGKLSFRLSTMHWDQLTVEIGDFNLAALDYLPKCGLEWVGNCNELNAGTVPPSPPLRCPPRNGYLMK